jgi:hypothetical protein
MARLILILLALFAAPALVWFAGRWLLHRNSTAQPAEAERWQDAPWMWLVLIGLAICVVAVFAFGILEPRDCQPVPTQMIDGKLVPAHCE